MLDLTQEDKPMSEFMGPPMSWYNPPELHELCAGSCCHEDHEDVEEWADEGCGRCVDILDKAVENKEYCLTHHAWYCEEVHSGEKAA
jgi:hypothetical protein